MSAITPAAIRTAKHKRNDNMNTNPPTRPYVGIKHNDEREMFRASDGPTQELYGSLYIYVIGPFKTVRGARFCQRYGRGNPHIYHVDDAERLAKAEARKARTVVFTD